MCSMPHFYKIQIPSRKSSGRGDILDLSGVNVDLMYKLYSTYSDA